MPAGRTNIVMVTYNRLDFTKESIEALTSFQTDEFRLTVVDNHSTDGTREYLRSAQERGMIHRVVLLQENVGVARASNIGWRLDPDAPYYLKLDNDIVVQKASWLRDLVQTAERVPDIGTLGYNFEDQSYPISPVSGIPLRPKRGSLGGACVLVSRKSHARFGYWNEEYGLYGEEDADMGLRVQAAGFLNAYMEDEHIGLHLPAGRAAKIDSVTRTATDGKEEVMHAEYRAWKDNQRRRNISKLKRNIVGYLAGWKSLYCPSTLDGMSWKSLLQTAQILPPMFELPPDILPEPERRRMRAALRLLTS